jgi:hypothetical protein
MSTPLVQRGPRTGVTNDLGHYAPPLSGRGLTADQLANNLKEIFGEEIPVNKNNFAWGAMQSYRSTPHGTSGIPYEFGGQSHVLERVLDENTLGDEDVVRLCVQLEHREELTILVPHVEMRGGDAQVTPEHAPVNEIERSEKLVPYELQRYANGWKLNTNLMNHPAVAQQHVSDFMRHQIKKHNHALNRCAWETIFREGSRLDRFLLATVGEIRAMKDNLGKMIEADKLYVSCVAFSMSKQQFAYENIFQQIGRFNLVNQTTDQLTIITEGGIRAEATKADQQVYHISGIQRGAHETDSKRIPYNGPVFEYKGHRMAVYNPPTDGSSGAGAYTPSFNPFRRSIVISTYCIVREPNEPRDHSVQLTDFSNGKWHTVNAAGGDALGAADEFVWCAKVQIGLQAESAVVFSDPGPGTGSIVVNRSDVWVSRSAKKEFAEIKATQWGGCYLNNPEKNILILSDVRCAGYEGGGGSSELLPGQGFYDDDEHDVLWFHTKTSPEQSKALLYDDGFVAQCEAYKVFPEYTEWRASGGNGTPPNAPIFYSASCKRQKVNTGQIELEQGDNALGCLDHPDNVDVVKGYQVFKDIMLPWAKK